MHRSYEQRLKITLACFVAALACTSLALVTTGEARSAAAVYLDTAPTGAEVFRLMAVTGRIRSGNVETGFREVSVGRAPGPLNLDRHAPAQLVLKLAGFADTSYLFDPSHPPVTVVLQHPRIPLVLPALYWVAAHPAADAALVFACLGAMAALGARRAARSEARDQLSLELGEVTVGSTLGGWRLGESIGRGASARVHRCERGGEEAAVKILFGAPGTEGRPRGEDRFAAEIAAMRDLRHPNLPLLLDYGEVGTVRYIVMEYVAGETLRDRLRRPPPLTPREIVDVGLQTCAALQAAHALGLVHRDVKPANVMLLGDGRVKLMDFGVAGEGGQGRLVGTPGYIAPEQIRGEVDSWRADDYALGAILFEALAGRPPFAHGASHAVLHAHATEAPPSLAALCPELPRGLTDLVMRLLAKTPSERCDDEAALARELQSVAAAL